MNKNLRAEAATLLLSDFSKEYIQEKLNQIFLLNKYSENDFQLLTNLVFGVLRNKLYLDEIIKNFANKKIKNFILPFLEIAIYQHLFLNKIPEYAIVSEMMKSADFFKININVKKFIRGVLSSYFKNYTKYEPNSSWANLLPHYIRYSHPEWIIEEWKKFLTLEEILQCLYAGNSIPDFSIFASSIYSKDELLNLLDSKKEEYIKNDDGFTVKKLTPELKVLLKTGKIFVQGKHQYNSIRLCPAIVGDKILEACAAPGGKTVHLNYIVGKEGKVFSIDKNSERLDLLKERIKLMSLNNVNPFVHDVLEPLPTYLPEFFDHIVLDPPCSNLGELSRRPEVRYRENIDSINSLSNLQKNMVNNIWKRLKTKGTFLYITCTLTYAENQAIKNYIKSSFNATLLKENLTLPSYENKSGGYACLFRKEH